MAIQIEKIIFSDARTLNGFYKGTFQNYGQILQVLVKPTSYENTYNFGIKDEAGFVIYAKAGTKGPIYEIVDIPLFPGEKSVIIEGATIDEPFQIKLIYRL